LIGRNKLLTA